MTELINKVETYINEQQQNGKSLRTIGGIFKGRTLPVIFTNDPEIQVKRYAQIIISNLLLKEQKNKEREITATDLDSGLFGI